MPLPFLFYKTEARAFEKRLIDCFGEFIKDDLKDPKILIEEYSQDTFQNVQLGLSAGIQEFERKGLLEKNGMKKSSVLPIRFISDDFIY